MDHGDHVVGRNHGSGSMAGNSSRLRRGVNREYLSHTHFPTPTTAKGPAAKISSGRPCGGTRCQKITTRMRSQCISHMDGPSGMLHNTAEAHIRELDSECRCVGEWTPVQSIPSTVEPARVQHLLQAGELPGGRRSLNSDPITGGQNQQGTYFRVDLGGNRGHERPKACSQPSNADRTGTQEALEVPHTTRSTDI